jgi:hypothetical protein
MDGFGSPFGNRFDFLTADDIIAGAGITITSFDGQVTINAIDDEVAIGGTVSGGVDTRSLYVGTGGVLAQDENFTHVGTGVQLANDYKLLGLLSDGVTPIELFNVSPSDVVEFLGGAATYDTTTSFLDFGSTTNRFTGDVEINGSTTLSSMTEGSVLFAGVGGILSQDNTNFFWDDTNNRLGIGVTPSVGLHVVSTNGLAYFADNATDATNKFARLAVPHYTNAEEPTALIYGTTSSSSNTVSFGGGSSLFNAATNISFYTAANNTTTTGTERMNISSAGVVKVIDGQFRLTDSDVATGFTTLTSTDVYFGVEVLSGTAGGALISGYGESAVSGLVLRGLIGAGDPTDTVPAMQFRAGKQSGTTGGTLGASETAYQFSDWDGGTDWVTILGSGNVGIGTATPAAALHIFGSSAGAVTDHSNAVLILEKGTSPTLQFQSANSQSAVGLIWGDPEDNDVGRLLYDHTADSMAFFVAGSQKMTLLTSGRLGIGTTTPNSELEVAGVANTTGGTLTLSRNDISVSADDVMGAIQFYGIDTQSSTSRVFGNIEVQSTAAISTDIAPGRMIFRTGDTTVGGSPVEAMRISALQYVGIGVTGDAVARLQAEQNGTGFKFTGATNQSQLVGYTTSAETIGHSVRWAATAGTGALTSFNSIGDILFTITDGGANPLKGKIEFRNNVGDSFAARMTISDAGNIGLGIDPTERLHVLGPSASADTYSIVGLFEGAGSATQLGTLQMKAYRSATAANQHFALQSWQRGAVGTTVKNLVLQPDGGNVGVGVSVPTGKVDITGGNMLNLIIGGDASSATTRTDATNKSARIGVAHYTNAEEPLGMFYATSTAAANTLNFGGGGTTLVNSATIINFYTAANTTTQGASADNVARFDNDTTAGNTRFMIWDVDNATLERVTVGAADSGGAGFKLLRIPN